MIFRNLNVSFRIKPVILGIMIPMLILFAGIPGKSGNQKKSPAKILNKLKSREWYKGKDDKKAVKVESSSIDQEADLSSLKKSTHEEIDTIIVLLAEVPISDRKSIIAPAFISEKKQIFNTRSDFSFKWAGYKIKAALKQEKFPFNSTTLSETIIGSFLYASGTNIGFAGGEEVEEKRFFTNYTSQIITMKVHLPLHLAASFTLDSRQYFFIRRDTPDDFIMPENHVNLFPRMDLHLEMLKEKGIDQLTHGVEVHLWAGYGMRSNWSDWGEPPNLEKGSQARTFAIYSARFTAGVIHNSTNNFVVTARYKGGIDNDFITRPRFGGSIDNARLSVVHGFSVDRFRVYEYSLVNARYGFDIIKRLRLNFFFDYAHVFSPESSNIIGSAYGLRIRAWGGLPIWISHGIGKILNPHKDREEHIISFMTAAGW